MDERLKTYPMQHRYGESHVKGNYQNTNEHYNVFRNIFVFPGGQKLVNKINNKVRHIKRKTGVQHAPHLSAVVFPPVEGRYSLDDVIKLNCSILEKQDKEFHIVDNHGWNQSYRVLPDELKKFFQEKIGKHGEIIAEYVVSYKHWYMDDNLLSFDFTRFFHALQICEYAEQSEIQNFAEFKEAKKAEHVEKALVLDFSSIQDGEMLYSLLMRNLLFYPSVITSAQKEKVDALSPEKIKEWCKRFPVSYSKANANLNFEAVYSNLMNENARTPDELEEKALSIVHEVFQKSDYADTLYEMFKPTVSQWVRKDKLGFFKEKTKIIDFVADKKDEWESLDLIVLFGVAHKPNALIRSISRAKVFLLMNFAIERLDEPEHFFKFLTEIFISDDYYMASYKEFMDCIKIDSSETFEFPVGIQISFMNKGRSDTIVPVGSRKTRTELQNKYAKYIEEYERKQDEI